MNNFHIMKNHRISDAECEYLIWPIAGGQPMKLHCTPEQASVFSETIKAGAVSPMIARSLGLFDTDEKD
jgi:hypothetical protein